MGEFPSGQRGQTVNLLRIASMVRIRPPPPNKKVLKPQWFLDFFFFVFNYDGYQESSKKVNINHKNGVKNGVNFLALFRTHIFTHTGIEFVNRTPVLLCP